MSPLHAIGTQGWFAAATGDRLPPIALGGWFGTGTGTVQQNQTLLRTHLRQRLVTDATFAALLGAPGAVYHRHPPAPMPTPCAVYELLPLAPGAFRLDLRLLAHHPAALDTMRDAVARLFEGYQMGIDGWRIHHMTRESAAPVEVTRTGRVVRYGQEVRYHITADALQDDATATILFTHNETTLTLPRPAEATREDTRLQAAGESTGGTFYLYDSGASQTVHALSFTRLSGDEAAALRGFFSLVEGMRHPFTYTDPDGVGRTVRFAGRSLALVQRGGGTWDTTLRLVLL